MTNDAPLPAKRPCGSCPYRQDVPSGVWAAEEYDKLLRYDEETPYQPIQMFLCHQQDGRLCAGWVGCQDMTQSLAVRMAGALGHLSPEQVDAVLDYETDTPLWGSGAEAAEHGRERISAPDETATRVIDKLVRKAEKRRSA